jgi:tetratricopeptide (TPR) repeat protein
MTPHPWWLLLLLACAGCQSVAPAEGPASRSPAVEQAAFRPDQPEANPPSARQLWEEGQIAMSQGQLDRAIVLYEQSLKADPRMARNHLSLAAAYLEKGDEAGACPHLARYVNARPEHLIIRVQYAELLWRLKRGREARAAFEDAVADAQDDMPINHLIHCHSRLMRLAEEDAEEYDEHLHRGIGLYLLARERAELPEPDGELSVEGLLCRAAGELTLAHLKRPDEARPSWYLYKVWNRLDQRRPALRSLRAAGDAAPFSYLTPAEQRGLQLAGTGAGDPLRK